MNPELGSPEDVARVKKYNKFCLWGIAISSLIALGAEAFIRGGPYLADEQAQMFAVFVLVCAGGTAILTSFLYVTTNLEQWAYRKLREKQSKLDQKHP